MSNRNTDIEVKEEFLVLKLTYYLEFVRLRRIHCQKISGKYLCKPFHSHYFYIIIILRYLCKVWERCATGSGREHCIMGLSRLCQCLRLGTTTKPSLLLLLLLLHLSVSPSSSLHFPIFIPPLPFSFFVF